MISVYIMKPTELEMWKQTVQSHAFQKDLGVRMTNGWGELSNHTELVNILDRKQIKYEPQSLIYIQSLCLLSSWRSHLCVLKV